MTHSLPSWKLKLAASLAIGWAITFSTSCVAQISPDTTLGSESSQVTSIGAVDTINGGATRGTNLLHSFGEFNLSEGRAAYFTNPAVIKNILSRVTGGNPSQILGRLGVLGNANLFLINSNGIIFGQNASLDVKGSFVGTTANGIGLTNGDIFSANPQATLPSGLLNVNPNALLFNQIKAGAIANRSTSYSRGLQVPQGKSLLLVGGDVSLNGGRIFAPGGRVELGSVAGQGTVDLNIDNSDLRLNFPENVARADVSLTNGSNVLTSGGGSIAINAQNLNLTGESRLLAAIIPGLGSIGSQGGNIEINATDTINLSNDSIISNLVLSGATGKGGSINITTGALYVTDGAQIITNTFGKGDAGSVNILAHNIVSFAGISRNGYPSGVISSVKSGAIGNSGDINITSESLSFTDGAGLGSSTLGQGNAGSIIINARDRVFFDRANAVSGVGETGIGKGGDLQINTGELLLTNSAQLSTSTLGRGDAGNVIINTRDRVSFDGKGSDPNYLTAIFSSVDKSGIGKGGDIRISTRELSLTNGAQLVASTDGEGDAGNIIIDARNRVSFDGRSSDGGVGSDAFSDVGRTGIGKGGEISISTRSLSVTNGAQLLAITRGQGNAGNVNINAHDTVLLQGVGNNGFSSLIGTANLRNDIAGAAGKITVNTGSFRIADGAIIEAQTNNSKPGGSVTINANTFEATKGGQIITTTYDSGKAGNITLNITDSLILSGSDPTYNDRLAKFGDSQLGGSVINLGAASGLFANTSPNSTGDGGNIFIDPRTVIIEDGAGIAVNSQGTGKGGNIQIQAGTLTLDNKAFISAETASNTGGNITLQDLDLLLLRRNSQISTTASAGGDGGNIDIDSKFIVAVLEENSDIIANAFSGSGGKVRIDATGIFGIAPISREDLEKLRPNDLDPRQLPTNDITAVSQQNPSLSGTVDLNTPNIEPNRGLVNLPAVPIDTEIAQGCTAGSRQAQSSFSVTGRGGLPPNPGEALNTDAVQVDLVTLNPEAQPSTTVSPTTTSPTLTPIVEAQGWAVDAVGNVVLTANAAAVTPNSSWHKTADCSVVNHQQKQ